ncbi:alpha/beta hydrolase [Panacagrimonas sp.]|uniref:alpha/beta hydrolase n=1 Tax=Panacagrimonas sp. TaxID=2480088 RepID=UPI003B526365
MKRVDVVFESGGVRCEAWLYLPHTQGPHPCVVVAHGIGAIRQVRLSAYAERFTAAGYAMLSFDYRHWGASAGSPRFLCSVRKQLQDISAAIACAAARPEIDDGRIALFGTSFGGGHAIVIGARHRGLAAVVSQCTVSDCLAVAMHTPFTQIMQWVAAALLDQARAVLGMSPKYIKLAGAPGETAMMTRLGAEEAYGRMLDGPSPWRNQIAARLMLTLPLYRPIRYARKVRSPLLMVVCERDEICPAALAHEVARRAPNGSAASFDASHFEIYFGELFEAATRTMLQFFDQHLGRHSDAERSGPLASLEALRAAEGTPG